MPAHIAALDIALQPRVTAYACPMKLLEYMAMARCIVAPDQPNIKELLSDGASARLFAPGDDRSLADSILELMDRPALRTRLGRHARRTVVERNLSWRAKRRARNRPGRRVLSRLTTMEAAKLVTVVKI